MGVGNDGVGDGSDVGGGDGVGDDGGMVQCW